MDPRPAHGAHDEEKAYAEDVAFGAVQDEHIDLGGYVLGSLSGAETISFEAHLAQCAACQAELEELGGLPEMLDLAAFAGWDVVPGGTRRPSEASSALQAPVPVAAAVPTAPVTPLGQRRPRGRRPAVWIGAAAAAVVAVALAVGATALSRRDTLPQCRRRPLGSAQQPSGRT